MSIETWKAEFYPKPARVTTVEEAAEHSLQKWQGYLPENLKRHGVSTADLARADMPYRSADMCALCWHHEGRQVKDNDGQWTCPGCPLYEIGEGCLRGGSAYNLTNGDHSTEVVNRMIAALERAVEWDKDHRGGSNG